MKLTHRALLACALSAITVVPVQAQDQTAAPASTTKPVIVGAPHSNILPEGTPIPLRTLTELSSRNNRVGDRFDLEVADDVMLNGKVVIPVGAKAVGEITKITKKGMFGKSGKLETRLIYVRVGDRQIPISGQQRDRGKGGTAGTVASLIFVWPAAFFVTGKSALLPPGTNITGYLESDLPVVFADVQPEAPLVVPAAAPAPAQPQ